jgi:ADP-heptose:LPS heptosyltransferase
MRLIDKHVGSLICRIVGLALWLFGRHIRRVDHPPPPPPETVREILIMKFFGMGSILQATPLIEALRRRYPGVRIRLLTFRANEHLEDFDLGIDEFLTIDPSRPRRFAGSTIRALWRLRKIQFDVLINLEFYATFGTLLTLMLRKRFALAFGGFAHYRDKFFHDFVSYDNTPHIQEKFLGFARRLGYEGPCPPLAALNVERPAHVVANVERRLGFDLHADDYRILVNINTGEMAPRRRWPVEHFRDVVEELARRPDVRCILIGGPGDRAYVDRFHAGLTRREAVINLAGRLSLAELVAFMEVSNLYLGNDSGPMHFAVCSGLPVLALFGPESPEVYGPPASPRNTVLYRAEPCGPCLNIYTDKNSRCRDNICLKRIPAAQVLDVLDSRYLRPRLMTQKAARVTLPLAPEPLAVP